MNNNRNNNRRRGRGNRQQGGGNQNRIDSRARGNAPQMFDKYKKLAQDAAHNGDRVQAEYYLQFADHYFRVIADNKARQDEQRGGSRRDERDYMVDDEGDEDDFDGLRQPQPARYDRQDRQGERTGGERGADRANDRQRPRQRPMRDERHDEARTRLEGEPGFEGEEAGDFGVDDNPFTRDSRERGNRNRDFGRERSAGRDGEGRRPRGRRAEAGGPDDDAGPASDAGEIDVAALPPAFARAPESEPAGEAAPKRKLPPRRRRAPIEDAGDEGDPLTAVG
ncbi:MAG: DUF4167 domain-containing protein [Cypionkella sp.]